MEYRYDSYCGLYCGACPALVGTARGQAAELAKEEKMTVEDVSCAGCKSDVTAVYCRDCDLRACARARGVEFCFDCGDYPCVQLTGFRRDKSPHHSVIFKNLNAIREGGAAAWLAEQERRWRCAACGERFTWYDRACEKCGAALYDCRQEERGLDV